VDKQYSRRQILRAIALGGGFIAGELWWPGRKLISIPQPDTELRYKATERYSYGWTQDLPDPGFGLAVVKPEGEEVIYDPGLVFSEASLEQMVVDIRRDQKDKLLSIKPRTIRVRV